MEPPVQRIRSRKRRRPCASAVAWGLLWGSVSVQGLHGESAACLPAAQKNAFVLRWRCGAHSSDEEGRDNDMSNEDAAANQGEPDIQQQEPSLEILSSSFLDDFDKEVSTLVSGYRSDVRDTFQTLQRDILTQRRQQLAAQQRRKQQEELRKQREAEAAQAAAKAAAEAAAAKRKIQSERPSQPAMTFHVDDSSEDVEDLMAGVDEEELVQRVSLDVFSDLSGAAEQEEDDELLIVGDTDEEEDVVLERLLATRRRQHRKHPRRDTVRSHSGTRSKAKKALDMELGKVETTPEKKKRKHIKKKKKKAETMVEKSATTTTQPEPLLTVRNLIRALSYMFLYVLTALLLSLMKRVLGVG